MSAHRRHRRGRAFQPNPYDPAKARQALVDAIRTMQGCEDREYGMGEKAGKYRPGKRSASDPR